MKLKLKLVIRNLKLFKILLYFNVLMLIERFIENVNVYISIRIVLI